LREKLSTICNNKPKNQKTKKTQKTKNKKSKIPKKKLKTENYDVEHIDSVYRMSQEECEILRESVPYVKLYRYNPKHLYQKLNGYGDNGQRSLKL